MSNTFKVVSPVDNSIYIERQFSSSSDIEKALMQSQTAQKHWKSTSLKSRAEICRRVVSYFVSHAKTIGEELTWQMGRPIQYTPYEISKGFQERALHMIDIAADSLRDVFPQSQEGFKRFIRKEPLGTVFVLAPWNYPYLTSVNAIIPAIMAGNSIVLKHATQTPLCAERYAEAFESAGAPQGLFQYLHLSHSQVASVVKDKRIGFVAFTGSVGGGAAVQKALGSRFINAGMELGGKDPAYVMEDAHLENAIENLVDGAFFNSGQSCCGIERIYVHKKHYKDFIEGAVAQTMQYRLGNPHEAQTTLGPMVKTSAADFVANQVKSAVSQGAQALINPSTFSEHQPDSPYIAPQILINVDHDMDIMTEETFGPAVGIMQVENDIEALQLMNDSQYGLSASLWTNDIERGLTMANDIETGTCFINRCDYLDPGLAWTGVKNSGKGCTLSSLGYDSITRPKSYHAKYI